MDNLPPEILHMVFTHLDKPDIYKARLTNQNFSRIGESHVTYTLYSGANESTIWHALTGARHPKFGVNCTSLIVNPSRPDEHNSLENWLSSRKQHLLDTAEDDPEVDAYVYDTLSYEQDIRRLVDEHSLRYQAFKQTEREEEDDYLRVQCLHWLGEVFETCPKMTELIVSDTEKRKIFPGGVLTEPCSWPFRHCLAEYVGEASMHILRNAVRSRVLLTRIALINVSVSAFGSSSIVREVQGAFTHLKEARVLLGYGSGDEIATTVSAAMNMGVLLAEALQLQVLKIGSWTSDMVVTEKRLHLDKVLISTHWPKLRTVAFRGFRATETELVNFFHQHKQLETIHLREGLLENGTWRSLLRRTSTQFPHLKAFRLFSLMISMKSVLKSVLGASVPGAFEQQIEYQGCTDNVCDQHLHDLNRALYLYVMDGGPSPPRMIPRLRFAQAPPFEGKRCERAEKDYDDAFGLGRPNS